MTTLLELKQAAKIFYMKYEVYITHVWKFLLALICLLLINGQLGYLAALNSFPIVLMAALLCSILPTNFTVIMAAVFVLGHLYELSRECMLIGLVLFLLMFLLYYRFSPKDTLAVLLTPICFQLHIPYAVPLALGLLGTPVSIISMTFGILISYFLGYVAQNATALGTAESTQETANRLQNILNGIISNKSMLVMMIAFAVVLLIVYVIRRLPIDHAWTIAIASGAITGLISLLIGDLLYDTQLSVFGAIIGMAVAVLLMKVLAFFSFNLDYSRTEKVQFEDDEYYYYVKAVPKVTVTTPEHKVKKINRAQNQRGRGENDDRY